MFLREIVGALAKLWYLVLCGVLLAAGAAYLVWTNTEPRYSSQASVLLLPPVSTTTHAAPDGSDSNPLLFLGGLGQARDVLISAMTSAAEQEKFNALFADTSYAIGIDPLSSGPIVVISTESANAETASQSVEYLLEILPQRFDEMQTELAVEELSEIRSMQLTPSTTPEADSKPQLRAAILVGAGVLVLTVFLIAVVDGPVRNARELKKQRDLADVSEQPDEGGDAVDDGAAVQTDDEAGEAQTDDAQRADETEDIDDPENSSDSYDEDEPTRLQQAVKPDSTKG